MCMCIYAIFLKLYSVSVSTIPNIGCYTTSDMTRQTKVRAPSFRYNCNVGCGHEEWELWARSDQALLEICYLPE